MQNKQKQNPPNQLTSINGRPCCLQQPHDTG